MSMMPMSSTILLRLSWRYRWLLLLLLILASIPTLRAYHVTRAHGPSTSLLVRSSRKGSILVRYSTRSPNAQSEGTISKNRRVSQLMDWAKKNDIRIASSVALQDSDSRGLGWFVRASDSSKNVVPSLSLPPSESILLSVPSSIALTVDAPGEGPDDVSVIKQLNIPRDQRKFFTNDLPWFVQFSLYLYKLRRINSNKRGSDGDPVDMRPWLDSLPQSLDSTPIHWNDETRQQLQYEPIVQAVQRQEQQWRNYHRIVQQQHLVHGGGTGGPSLTWDDFLWGCEMARSRAFSGGYSGTPFNPYLYAFTLLLVGVYVALHLGTVEQAANGAGVVLCGFVLRDFVIPKLFQRNQKRYVICPLIDMTNHHSMAHQAQVSYEFFNNAYSLSFMSSSSSTPAATQMSPTAAEEILISYGARSNDQLLQYYGFVEHNNPNDVYLLPPLREWDLTLLEQSCQRTIAPGRLAALDRAGLLGTSVSTQPGRDDASENDIDDDDNALNRIGRVVVARAVGLDPAVLQALRALLSTEAEWQRAGQAVGSFAEVNSGGIDNENCARKAAKAALQQELDTKPTTLEQDQALLRQVMETGGRRRRSSMDISPEELLAVQFRIEKKKLLFETIDKLA